MSSVRTPGPAEVVIEVSGAALGVDPHAEIAGRVVDAGEHARDLVGRRVVVPRVLPCGDCDHCRRGRAATCPQRAPRHGFATQETVPARYLCPVEPPLWPPALDAGDLWQLAALPDAVATPYGALTRAGVAPSELVVVLGGGPRGAFTVALARALGAHAVLVESGARLQARALELGARFAVDADRDPDETRLDLEARARALGIGTFGYKIVETTATPAGRHRAVAMLPDGGTAALLDGGDDLPHTLPPLPWKSFATREAQVFGASACHPDLFPELMALVVRGEVPIGQLVTRVAPADADSARAAVREGRLDRLPIVVF
jgi:6-hydroxycyclohex-1-ene-1-carbonyl-CoA dehydrogenase